MGYWDKRTKPAKGIIRVPDKGGAWYGFLDNKQKRYMTRKEAQKWMRETGKPVFFKSKKFILDEQE